MEINPTLAPLESETHSLVALGTTSTFNILKLQNGVCHTDGLSVTLNGEDLDESQYMALLPSSEFESRYLLDNVSMVMILDNDIRGDVVINVKPVGGIWADVDLSALPMSGELTTYVGRYLEEYGSIPGVTNTNELFENLPSDATDIDGVAVTVSSATTTDSSTGTTDAAVLARLEAIEALVIHTDDNTPVLTLTETLYDIMDAKTPLVQFGTDLPRVTWHLDDSRGTISGTINKISGELTSLDSTTAAGYYTIYVYVMSNGMKSNTVEVTVKV